MQKSITTLLSTSLLAIAFFGVASAQLTDTLDSANVSTCVQLTKGMTFGSRDATTDGQVSDLQFFLNDKGYLKTDPTGYFGAATVAAVKEFQGANGITQNGVVGPITRGKIATISCSRDEPTTGGTDPVTTNPTTPVSQIGNLSVSLSYTGGGTNGSAIIIPSNSSATGVNPLSPRTWSWRTTGAASVSARYTISGENCGQTAGLKVQEEGWQPWLGTNITGNRFLGSNTRSLDASYYGCTVEATYKARNVDNQVVSSTVTVKFAEKNSTTPITYTCNGVQQTTPCTTVTNPVACTMDAKMCPDGSYVGRTGPSCAFAACPTTSSCSYRNPTTGSDVIFSIGGTATPPACTTSNVGAISAAGNVCRCGPVVITNPTVSQIKYTGSNSLSGPFVENPTLNNSTSNTSYFRITGVTRATASKGCTELVGTLGSNSCDVMSNYRTFTASEWINETTVQTVLAGGLIQNGNFETYVADAAGMVKKVGNFTLRASADTSSSCSYKNADGTSAFVFGGTAACTTSNVGQYAPNTSAVCSCGNVVNNPVESGTDLTRPNAPGLVCATSPTQRGSGSTQNVYSRNANGVLTLAETCRGNEGRIESISSRGIQCQSLGTSDTNARCAPEGSVFINGQSVRWKGNTSGSCYADSACENGYSCTDSTGGSNRTCKPKVQWSTDYGLTDLPTGSDTAQYKRTWSGSTWGSWTFVQCRSGNHAEGSSTNCVPDVKDCTMANGQGRMTYNTTTNQWGMCERVTDSSGNPTCAAGFVYIQGSCIAPERNCTLSDNYSSLYPRGSSVATGIQRWGGYLGWGSCEVVCKPGYVLATKYSEGGGSTFNLGQGVTSNAIQYCKSKTCPSGTGYDSETDSCVTPRMNTSIEYSPTFHERDYQCTIPVGGSRCSVTVKWNPKGFVSLKKFETTAQYNARAGESIPVAPGSKTFTLTPTSTTEEKNLILEGITNNGNITTTSGVSAACISGSTWNGSSCQSGSQTSGTTAPSAPWVNLTTTSGTAGSALKAYWSAAGSVTSYYFMVDDNGTEYNYGSATEWDGTTGGLWAGSPVGPHSIKIKACNSAGCSPWSSSASYTITAADTVFCGVGGSCSGNTTNNTTVTAPSAPWVTLTQTSGTAGSALKAYWGAAGSVTSYYFMVDDNGTEHNYGLVTTWDGTTSGLWNGSGPHSIKIKACNSAGCSPWSPSASYTITSSSAGNTTNNTTVAVPSNPVISIAPTSGNSGDILKVDWNATGSVTSYYFMVDNNGTEYNYGSARTWSGTTGELWAGSPAGPHSIKIKACNSAGCSPWSSSASYTITAPASSGTNNTGNTSSNNTTEPFCSVSYKPTNLSIRVDEPFKINVTSSGLSKVQVSAIASAFTDWQPMNGEGVVPAWTHWAGDKRYVFRGILPSGGRINCGGGDFWLSVRPYSSSPSSSGNPTNGGGDSAGPGTDGSNPGSGPAPSGPGDGNEGNIGDDGSGQAPSGPGDGNEGNSGTGPGGASADGGADGTGGVGADGSASGDY